jgi:hypothetical protein
MSAPPVADWKVVADELAIRRVLATYCRAIDRCDADLLRSVYWPDAVDDHGVFNGNALEFVDFILPMLRTMRVTTHSISNVLIELDGDEARAETYVNAYHDAPGPEGRIDIVVAGRYLDRFERRDGHWRIAHRQFVMDWNQNLASTAQWDGPLYGALDVRGTNDRADPSYSFFARR